MGELRLIKGKKKKWIFNSIEILIRNHRMNRKRKRRPMAKNGFRFFRRWIFSFTTVSWNLLLRQKKVYSYHYMFLDKSLTQKSGYHTAVHYLFNNLISNLSNEPFNLDLLNTWRNLYEVSHHQNATTVRTFLVATSSSFKSKFIQSDIKYLKYIFVISLCIVLVIIINIL